MATFLIDCDGVLCNFTEALLRDLRAHGCELQSHEITEWDFIRDVLTAKQRDVAYDLCADAEWWRELPVIAGAESVVNDLLENDHNVLFVSSPWVACEGWEFARRDWLKRKLGVNDAAKRFLSLPSELKSHYRGDVLIDDKPETVVAWQANHPHGRGWLYHAPYNHQVTWQRRLEWPLHPEHLSSLHIRDEHDVTWKLTPYEKTHRIGRA